MAGEFVDIRIHTTSRMTDLFFPSEAPPLDEFRAISLACYYVQSTPKEGFCIVQWYSWANSQPVILESIKVPATYYAHLRHFLWRHHIFMELISRSELIKDGVVLSTHAKQMIQKYIWYMDAMGEGLMTPVRSKANQGWCGFRSNLFDLYLLVEYYVGRHEHDVVSTWLAQHPNVHLEAILKTRFHSIGMSNN